MVLLIKPVNLLININIMRQLLLILLFFGVISGGTYVGLEWVQKQAYVVFARQYVQEVSDLS